MDYDLVLPLSLVITFLIVGNIAYTYFRYKEPRKNLIALWFLLYAVYVFLVPALYGIFSDFESTRSYGIESGQLILVYFFEVGFLIIFFVAFHSRLAKNIGRSVHFFVTRPDGKAEINLLLVFSLSLLILQLDQILGGLPSYGRVLQYDANVQMANTSYFGIPIMILAPLKALFVEPGKIAAALLITMPYNAKRGFSRFMFNIYKIVALGVLTIVGIWGLAVGVRHITLGVFILIFAAGFLQKRYKYIWCFIIGFIFMIAIGPLVGSTYRVFLSSSSSSGLGIQDRLLALTEMKNEATGQYLYKLWDEIGIRLVDARLSCGLIKYVEREVRVGLNPLLNSLCAPIPRLLWQTKPAPRSYDGTHKGLAGFLVWKELIGREWGMWGGYTAAVHSWWEFNLPGIIMCSLIYGAFLRIIIESTSNKGYIGLLIFLLAVNVESFGSFYMKTLPDVYLFVFQKLLPILILLKLWTKLGQFKILKTAQFKNHVSQPVN